MLVKIVIVFLGAMVLIGLIGKVLFPKAFKRVASKGAVLPKPARCRRCGRYLLGKGGCDCGKA